MHEGQKRKEWTVCNSASAKVEYVLFIVGPHCDVIAKVDSYHIRAAEGTSHFSSRGIL